MLSRYGLLQARLKGQGELANESGWAVGEMADSRLMVVGIDEEMDKDLVFLHLSPLLVHFRDYFFSDEDQAECTGTGERTHTLGSRSHHRIQTGLRACIFSLELGLIVWLHL